MRQHKIAVIPGDGIGIEVITEAKRIMTHIEETNPEIKFDYRDLPWGSEYYRQTGLMMPEDGLDDIKDSDAILFGAVGDPKIPDHITLQGLLLPMRRQYDQGISIRPAYLYPGVRSPIKDKQAGDIDMVIFRENTEGEYAPVGGSLYSGTEHEIVVQTNVFTKRGTERIIEAAFEYCLQRNSKLKVTSVTKSNAQAHSMVFWDEVFDKVAAKYPQIQTESLLVDAACMDLVRWPENFDVIVASNLFGDIMSDIAAVITGSMGLAPSANINPEREFPSMFEPVHGAGFDITGKGIANPIATFFAISMMLEHLGEHSIANELNDAIINSLTTRKVLTPDLGGTASTSQVTDEIIKLMG
tara:strand:+ start:6121 stop:7188 length:1068 start_codon:yes stop_codon:yes gene_type:complete